MLISRMRTAGVAFGVVFGLLALGCEEDLRKYEKTPSTSSSTTTSATEPAAAAPESSSTTSTQNPSPSSTNTANDVLNDDPNCELIVKYQGHDIDNEGQVHYVKRVLVSEPFGSANPVCVQYNDTQVGEVTVWKDTSSRGRTVDVLPSDRGINKVVVWYQ